MIPLSEARDHVLSKVEQLAPRQIALEQALGLVLAEPVHASDPIPGFANTAMDGYAVQAADTNDVPVELAVVGTIGAGHDGNLSIGPGQSARIMTGAPLPEGADAVVKVESTSPNDAGDRVRVQERVEPGNHIRYPGEDVAAGERVLEAGLMVTPGRVGLLASVGAYEVAAFPRPRVGVLSTGDELVDTAVPLWRGQIRDTNRRILLSLVTEAGFEGVDLGIARDCPSEIERAFRIGAADCDAVLSSGGVSMGDYDYVKVVLDQIGDMRWMQIAIKPAKPFAFGVIDSVPVFGLPGNPVSSMVSFELLAKPALRLMAGFGADDLGPNIVKAVFGDDRYHSDTRTHYMRMAARRDSSGALHVTSSGGQGSHQLAAMTRADALAIIPANMAVSRGDLVDVIMLNTRI